MPSTSPTTLPIPGPGPVPESLLALSIIVPINDYGDLPPDGKPIIAQLLPARTQAIQSALRLSRHHRGSIQGIFSFTDAFGTLAVAEVAPRSHPKTSPAKQTLIQALTDYLRHPHPDADGLDLNTAQTLLTALTR